jgi:hypothetical protein
VGSPRKGAMSDELIMAPKFRQASMATADRVLRLLKTDAVAFGGDGREGRPRLTAPERLERLRQRRTA